MRQRKKRGKGKEGKGRKARKGTEKHPEIFGHGLVCCAHFRIHNFHIFDQNIIGINEIDPTNGL